MANAELDAPLPAELTKLGQPHKVYRLASSWESLALVCAGVFMFVAAVICVVIYLKVPFKKNDSVPPITMLYIAAGIAVMGLMFCLGAVMRGDLGKRSADAYLLYPNALALWQGDSCTLVRWSDVTGLVSPKNMGDYHLTTRDGRTLAIKHAVKDYSGLIADVFTRATAVIVAPLREKLAEGETISFGPFELNDESISYKGKTLPWHDVAVVRVEIGALGRRLRIRAHGSPLPWCYCNLESFPNGVLFPDLLRSVCPPRLLANAQ
jgi:hypothetical protein